MAVFYKLHYALRRSLNRQRAKGSALQSLYDEPPFSSRQRVWDTRFLVVDCEMSGLDPSKDHLLSLGWVLVEKMRIRNASAKHILVHAERGAGDSTLIHGLHDSKIAGAKSVARALMQLLNQVKNCVLVFHHAPLDVAFLQRAARSNFRCPLLLTCVDTLAIEKRRIQLQGKSHSLRLSACRQRYGLPEVAQHNALADAVATAELLLAQASHIGRPESLMLGHLPLQVF